MMKIHDTRYVFEIWARKLPRAQIGGLIKEYIAESNHQGWDGFSSRDITAIRRFLEDLMRYHDNYLGDVKELATKISNVNPV